MSAVRVLRNAFHILGLPSGADLSQIRQRANHLLNLARIEETEVYETDIPGVQGFRSEENIRKALEHLTNIKSKFLETFFWFEISTIQDQQSLRKLIKSDFSGALSYWHELSRVSPNWLAKKNEALAGYIATYQTGDNKYFENSLLIWREIGNDDRFWEFYKRHYEMSDDLGTDISLFKDFRSMLSGYLSWLALDLYRKHQNPEIVKLVFNLTGMVGLGIENHILNPVVMRLKNYLQAFEQLTSQNSCDEIRLRTGKVAIEDSISQLSAFGVDEYSPVKVLREQCGAVFRAASIKAHNEWDNLALTKELHNSAASLAASESTKAQMKADGDQLTKNENWTSFLSAFKARSKDSDPIHNYRLFQELESQLTPEVKKDEGFSNFKRDKVASYLMADFENSKKSIDDKRFDEAQKGMDRVRTTVRENSDLFHFNSENLVKYISDLTERAGKVSNRRELPVIERMLAGVQDSGNNTKWAGGDYSRIAFIIVGQSAVWAAIIPLLRELGKPKKLFGIF